MSSEVNPPPPSGRLILMLGVSAVLAIILISLPFLVHGNYLTKELPKWEQYGGWLSGSFQLVIFGLLIAGVIFQDKQLRTAEHELRLQAESRSKSEAIARLEAFNPQKAEYQGLLDDLGERITAQFLLISWEAKRFIVPTVQPGIDTFPEDIAGKNLRFLADMICRISFHPPMLREMEEMLMLVCVGE